MEIGIDFGGTSAKLAFLNEKQILARETVMLDDSSSMEQSLGQLEVFIKERMADFTIPKLAVDGIGMALPSLVDNQKNRVLSEYVKYTDANTFDLSGWSKKHFGCGVFLENDAKAALVGENQVGAASGCQNVAMITIGTGIGSAVIMEGKLLNGRNFAAGNLMGHTIINMHGVLCNCKGRGCAESEGSGWQLEELYNSESDLFAFKGKGFKALFEEASAGNPRMLEIYEKMISVWQAILINVVHCFDPELILLGGGVAKGIEGILDRLQAGVNAHCWTPNNSNSIKMASLGGYAGAIGAAYLPIIRQNH